MRKEKMLVVEDEDIMREALFDYFSSEGHKVDTASDGKKSLEKINFSNYDVMIIDLRLPGRDGLSILKDVRAQNPEAKVIMITAYPSLESEEEAKRNGATDYLTKPFELDYLDTLIRQSLEIVPTAPVEEPAVEELEVEEETPTPCIWTQAGIIKKRSCTHRYECHRGCDFYLAMMKKEKFRNDPRIKPFIERVNSLLGKNQCRYTMSGELSFRSCARLYNCASCELDQMIQYKRDQELLNKKLHRKRIRAKKYAPQVTVQDKSERSDH
jgi:CheY-like chemotaxis protein